MKTVWKLFWAEVRLRPARTILTALAVTASSCVVVWVASGYDALLGQSVDDKAAAALGRYDLIITPGGGPGARGGGGSAGVARKAGAPATKRGGRPGGGPMGAPEALPRDFIDALKSDEKIAEANLTTRSTVSVGRAEPDADAPELSKLLRSDRPPVLGMPPLSPPLIGTDAAGPPYELSSGRWIDQAAGDRSEAVLSEEYAEKLNVAPGDDLQVNSEVGRWVVKLVGIIDQPAGSGGRGGGGGQAGLFVSLPLAETINGYPARVARINIALNPGVDAAAHREELLRRLSETGTSATVVDAQALKESLSQGLSQSQVETLAYSATGVALLAALFIIFTTLSMGVSERGRELAVLRAVGLTKGQVAGLIFLEGCLLALLGWLGGLAAGWGLLKLVAAAKPELFAGGATLGLWCVALTAAAAIGGALGAAIQPAWRATRVTPLDAMAPVSVAPPARWVGPTALIGLIPLSINPLLTYVLPMDDEARIWAYGLIGYPAMVLGFLMLAPLVVVIVERAAGPTLAKGLGLPPRLLETSLSTNLWRTLGTTIALTVGLGLFIATQVWGYSMLAPFTPGDWAPAMLVGFEPSGLPDDQIEAVKRVAGVNANRCAPMLVEQPRLAEDPTHSSAGFSVVRQDNVVLIGVDVETAFGGDDPLIAPSFVVGDRKSALEKLKSGAGCLVPDHFLEESGLKLGDPLKMVPPDGPPGAIVSYPIVGAVSLPGWHWMTKMTGLRRRAVRAGALVFAPIADVKRDFKMERVNFFWFDGDGGASPEAIEASLQAIAGEHGEAKFRVAGVGEVTSQRPYARLTATETVRRGIFQRADGMIWGMSQIPLVTLLVTSLAVVNTIVSSVRSRRWELGVLRAIGTTRGGLVRLILAESLLIGLAVCLLSFAFGATAGWCGAGMSRYLSPFGGMSTPLVIPWARLGLGVAVALALCLLAALLPAVSAGRTEPLELLREGRGAA